MSNRYSAEQLKRENSQRRTKRIDVPPETCSTKCRDDVHRGRSAVQSCRIKDSKEAEPHPSRRRSLSRSSSIADCRQNTKVQQNDQPQTAQKTRASPGTNLVLSNKNLFFSSAPRTRTTAWRGPTPAFNKKIWCEAFAAIAASQARKAASSLWDIKPPTTDAELDMLMERAVMKLTIREGPNLLEIANACRTEYFDDVKNGKPCNGRSTFSAGIPPQNTEQQCTRKRQPPRQRSASRNYESDGSDDY
ncbi:tegument protein VP22 [Spheniscid alphaherpesvirus 1]|uniref:Tegument protein VP22 n=1 Tax=Spheniscid alphaherpesvirus 1 TaxID=2560777 RepID=A0A1R3T407_9ALPH|nr:tegument protein VP22 [Spheniscid alphaherpesvirus 1]SCO83502.1 tegument protein VP22 [Spheniscid alphaherpesvirus 1]